MKKTLEPGDDLKLDFDLRISVPVRVVICIEELEKFVRQAAYSFITEKINEEKRLLK